PAVIASLGELVAQPTTPFRRACLIDALADIGSAECVPPLLALLVDHHPCVALSRSARFAQRVLAEFPGLVSDPTPTSSPTTTSALAPATVAERAAAALAQITGVDEPFSSDASPAQQQHAAQRWADWHAAQTERP
ncbi:MAG: hypothetical protein KKB50_09825, partial [Planctomycetes bacterium]|nr:hypothetical protein [Planctomycetota bacterium]